MIHSCWLCDARRVRSIVGSATLRMVLSRTTTSRLTTRTPRIAHRRSCTVLPPTVSPLLGHGPFSGRAGPTPGEGRGRRWRYATVPYRSGVSRWAGRRAAHPRPDGRQGARHARHGGGPSCRDGDTPAGHTLRWADRIRGDGAPGHGARRRGGQGPGRAVGDAHRL